MNDAIHAIQQTILLYGQLLDDLRMEEWGRLFTDSAIWAMPGFVFEGREAIIKGVRAIERLQSGFRQRSSIPSVEGDHLK
jgi:hypothetical protein